MENKVIIKPKSRIYELKFTYHSDMKCENYDAEMLAYLGSDGRVTFVPREKGGQGFIFDHSDPDRVIALTKMMQEFAYFAKYENKNAIDKEVAKVVI